MSTGCAFDSGFDDGFEICTAVVVTPEPDIDHGWSSYNPGRVVRGQRRQLLLGGVVDGTTYTDEARIIMHPLVGAEAYATPYTSGAAVVRTSEPAQARMLARLTGAAWATGEFSAGAVLVDDDVEALMLLGVI